MELLQFQSGDVIGYRFAKNRETKVIYLQVVQYFNGVIIVRDASHKERVIKADESRIRKVGWLERLLHVPRELKS